MFLNEGPAQLPPPSRMIVPGSREGFITDCVDEEKCRNTQVGLNKLAYQES